MNPAPTIRLLGPGDAAVLENVAQDVFDEDINPLWTAEFLRDPRHHMVVALLGKQVIELGVAPSYRQQGIGRQLVTALFSHARELGCKEAWLGTEESNAAARRLYASVGGVEESMVYITFQLDHL
jgi:GNAT superfamily N-acetyltransferase